MEALPSFRENLRCSWVLVENGRTQEPLGFASYRLSSARFFSGYQTENFRAVGQINKTRYIGSRPFSSRHSHEFNQAIFTVSSYPF